jgi:hypothetical protein
VNGKLTSDTDQTAERQSDGDWDGVKNRVMLTDPVTLCAIRQTRRNSRIFIRIGGRHSPIQNAVRGKGVLSNQSAGWNIQGIRRKAFLESFLLKSHVADSAADWQLGQDLAH